MNSAKMLSLIEIIDRTDFKDDYDFDKNGNLLLRNSDCLIFNPKPKIAAFNEFVIMPFYLEYNDAVILSKCIKMCDNNKWRLPTVDELKSIILFLNSVGVLWNVSENIEYVFMTSEYNDVTKECKSIWFERDGLLSKNRIKFVDRIVYPKGGACSGLGSLILVSEK